jgi:hypothetical protein
VGHHRGRRRIFDFRVGDDADPHAAVAPLDQSAGDKAQTVTWEVFATPARRARNVILFIGDGLSVAHRTAARVLSKGLAEGRYGGELAIDDMPHMALVSTSGSDSLVTDSANSMSAYTTGHKSCVNAMGIYCARNKNGLAHPKVETIAEQMRSPHRFQGFRGSHRESNRRCGLVLPRCRRPSLPFQMLRRRRGRSP